MLRMYQHWVILIIIKQQPIYPLEPFITSIHSHLYHQTPTLLKYSCENGRWHFDAQNSGFPKSGHWSMSSGCLGGSKPPSLWGISHVSQYGSQKFRPSDPSQPEVLVTFSCKGIFGEAILPSGNQTWLAGNPLQIQFKCGRSKWEIFYCRVWVPKGNPFPYIRHNQTVKCRVVPDRYSSASPSAWDGSSVQATCIQWTPLP